jgi:hypothetical protein
MPNATIEVRRLLDPSEEEIDRAADALVDAFIDGSCSLKFSFLP